MNFVSGLPQDISRSARLQLISSWIDPSTILTPKYPITFYHDDQRTSYSKQVGERILYLQGEPEVIIPKRQFLLKNFHLFDYILTWDEVILHHCPNAVKYIFGGCWVHPSDRLRVDINEKQFAVSTLVGSKAQGEGHILRQRIFTDQAKIASVIPKVFYRSSKGTLLPDIDNNPIYTHDSKFELFRNVQYSIVIENSKENNYFTEKLIDCFITKTIPIYWGCPNIGTYFYTEGMICLQTTTIEELLQKLSELTPETYANMFPMLEENYKRALQYVRVEDNINRALRGIPNY